MASVFDLIAGAGRLFHLDEMEDVGFALLTGGGCCPARHTAGGWRRHLPWYEVDASCRRTGPWELLTRAVVLVGYDEQTVPRWAHKFQIPEGSVATRDKHMRCEKLFSTFDLSSRRYLAVRAAPGDRGLIGLAVPLVRPTPQQGRPAYRHALFGAGAGPSDAGVRALWDLAEECHPRLGVALRACRYPHRVRLWEALPADRFVAYEEPGPCRGAPAKETRLADTATALKGESPEEAVRAAACREVVPGPKKDRWHPRFTTSRGEPPEVLAMFRGRRGHEQAYRVGAYDEFLGAVPCGYDQESPHPQRPRLHRGPLQMSGWLVAPVYNAVADWAAGSVGDWEDCHLRAVRRTSPNRPGRRHGRPAALIVPMGPLAGQEALAPVIDAFSTANHRIPWLDNRRLVMSLPPRGRAGPRP